LGGLKALLSLPCAGSAEHQFGMKQCHDAELVLGVPGQGLKALRLEGDYGLQDYGF